MNEEVNFCSQCGVKISSDAKFCSSCGHDLKNSSTKITLDNKITLDKAIKVEVTNGTVEKVFKAVKNVFKTKEKTSKSPKRLERQPDEPGMTITEIIKSLVFYVLIPVAVLIGILLLLAFLGSISGNN